MTEHPYSTLRESLTAVDARLHVIDSDAQAVAVVLRLLDEERRTGLAARRTIGVTDEPLLREWGMWKGLRAAGCHLVEPLDEDASPGQVEAWKKGLAGCRMGLTSALGIAEETGSLLLPPRHPDQRMVSLLPERHVALLTADRVVPTVDALMARWVETGDVSGSAVFVTGPSRTADIEKELVLGVHGPQAVDIILLV